MKSPIQGMAEAVRDTDSLWRVNILSADFGRQNRNIVALAGFGTEIGDA